MRLQSTRVADFQMQEQIQTANCNCTMVTRSEVCGLRVRCGEEGGEWEEEKKQGTIMPGTSR